MKRILCFKLRRHLICTVILLTPTWASAGLHGVFEGAYSTYNLSGAYSYGAKMGVSYESAFGTDCLLGSVFHLKQGNDSVPMTLPQYSGVGIALRHGFSFTETFEPYIEYGRTHLSSDDTVHDALGNEKQLKLRSSGDYLSTGILYHISKNCCLDAAMSWYGITRSQHIDSFGSDALGNSVTIQHRIRYSGTIGILFRF